MARKSKITRDTLTESNVFREALVSDIKPNSLPPFAPIFLLNLSNPKQTIQFPFSLLTINNVGLQGKVSR
ncbi:hypothetical protein C1H46_020905 [Malus baccata]|uniref:Uncharacterized protein n=1 Tax=Malus baccata TaxID=106549 RepID=A0A540M410_MALBA|nr:hypothetical protein C1H46_020903 [Malus baccata]TQD93484.1 hypothetical protein C1H46_020905 [Malus baccata]